MISATCFFLILVIPPFFFAVRRGKRFEETAAVSAGGTILLLFLCGLFGRLALDPNQTAQYLSRQSVLHSLKVNEPYAAVADSMLSLAGGGEKRVWVIAQGQDDNVFWPLRYAIRPCDAANAYLWSLVPTPEDLAEDDNYSTPENWLYQLQDYDCVLLYSIDGAFRENYASVFENPEDIGPERIFTVDHERDLLVRIS